MCFERVGSVSGFLFLLSTVTLAGPRVVPLWPQGVPGNLPVAVQEERTIRRGNEVGYGRVQVPTLEVFLPSAKAAPQRRAAVLVCPGGGYVFLAYSHEGTWIARRLNEMGLVAAVLKYRLPDPARMTEPWRRPLQDAQRALQLLHERAGEWGVDPNRVGIMGFSAGGHLAATTSTRFHDVQVEGASVTEVKPAFSILVYPVVSMTTGLTHPGSRERLLGPNPPQSRVQDYSNEMQVSDQMAPVFLVHALDDRVVDVENSLRLFGALRDHGVPVELHLLDRGGHGFGWRPGSPRNRWLDWVPGFLRDQGLLP